MANENNYEPQKSINILNDQHDISWKGKIWVSNCLFDNFKFFMVLPAIINQTKQRGYGKVLGMHDIYRTDKLSTDMGENDIVFIAPINKWNLISRSDKVRLLVNQSISLIYLRFICFPSSSDFCFKLQWLSACAALITSSFGNMSSPVWKFSSVTEEDNAIAICNACSARILRGGKKASRFNTTNLISHLKSRHRGEAVLT